MGGFEYEMYKEEEDYGLGDPNDREFKIIRYDDGEYYEGEVKKVTNIPHGRGLVITQ